MTAVAPRRLLLDFVGCCTLCDCRNEPAIKTKPAQTHAAREFAGHTSYSRPRGRSCMQPQWLQLDCRRSCVLYS